jgi:hypothetical protein
MSPARADAPVGFSFEERAARRIRDLEARVASIERGNPIPLGAGAPTAASQDGTLHGDSTNVRLWLRVGGAWRWTALT